MALPQDERLMRLRRLARQLEGSAPSRERDELLGRVRVRVVETEAWEELGPPTSLPQLADESAQSLLPWTGPRRERAPGKGAAEAVGLRE